VRRTPLALAPDEAALRRRCRAALREQRRRSRTDHQPALGYTLADLERLARSQSCCSYCGVPLDAGTFAFDHRVPTSRGGRHAVWNLAVCCQVCNERKGCLTEGEYRQLLALLRTWHPKAGSDVLARLRSGGRRYGVSRRGGSCP
jgi:5-methylcytosine-specific restriction endonuclease McrA